MIIKICKKHGELTKNYIGYKYYKHRNKLYPYCKKCAKENSSTEKFKLQQKNHRKKEHVKKMRIEYQREYRKTDGQKIKKKLYRENYFKNPEKIKLSRDRQRKYYSNPEVKNRQYIYHKNKCKNLEDSYVALTLKMPVNKIPIELLEAKKVHLKLVRKLKEIKNVDKKR